MVEEEPVIGEAVHGLPQAHEPVRIEIVQRKVRHGNFCAKALGCGHLCKGMSGCRSCMPCIERECVNDRIEPMMEPQDMMDGNVQAPDPEFIEAAGTDNCGLCHVKQLQELPCVRIKCGHVFHVDCIER